ncbi:histidine kinase [Marinobacter sp. 1Y8]
MPLRQSAKAGAREYLMTPRSPIVNRIALVAGAITILALTNILASLAMSYSIKGNATAINLAGTLRLYSYELLADSNQPGTSPLAESARQQRLKIVDQRIRELGETKLVSEGADNAVGAHYVTLLSFWTDELVPVFSQPRVGALDQNAHVLVQHFVSDVTRLVDTLDHNAEKRIEMMGLIQGLSLGLTVLVSIFLFVDIKRRVIWPLNRLMQIAGAVTQKDFSLKADLPGNDELAKLGQAFDEMTAELSESYRDLQHQSHAKTVELERSHAALALLHRTSRTLFSSHDLCRSSVPMLQQLERILGVGPISLYLDSPSSQTPLQVVTTSTHERPSYCRDHDCSHCLTGADHEQPAANSQEQLRLPITSGGQHVGVLEVCWESESGLPAASRRLLETVRDQLATAIYLERQSVQEKKITLSEERAVIARELHDSLAQSLTYLKMQVARLHRLRMVETDTALYGEIVDELGSGLDFAYRQLRELLTTFRLKLDSPDFYSALQSTAQEFEGRLGAPVELEYDLSPQMLSPNEELHIIQIVREALANVVKHASASRVAVSAGYRYPSIYVVVTDNGVGMQSHDKTFEHYGLIIMKDRARSLGGELKARNRSSGGVEITLAFTPKSIQTLISTTAIG